MAPARRIWITRTEPGASRLAAKLAAMGWRPVTAPVLAARPLASAALDLAGVSALAFTSVHGVAAFAALSPERDMPVFTVGAATAAAARRAGFAAVASAEGGARALAELIAEARPALVLAPGASEAAADLPALLSALSVSARAVAVYQTVATGAAPDLAALDAVVVQSARAAGIVADQLRAAPGAERLVAYVLSEAAAEPLRGPGLARVAIAARPTEAALLALIEAAP